MAGELVQLEEVRAWREFLTLGQAKSATRAEASPRILAAGSAFSSSLPPALARARAVVRGACRRCAVRGRAQPFGACMLRHNLSRARDVPAHARTGRTRGRRASQANPELEALNALC